MTLKDLRPLTPVEIDYIIDNIYKLLKEKLKCFDLDLVKLL
mgnify:CR=1 FL=1